MPEPWRRHLSELFSASPQDRADWLAAHPLRAILKDKAAGEIRRSDLKAYRPREKDAPFRWLFRWQSGGTFANVTLPSGVAFTALRFIEMPDGPMPYCIQFDTDHGTVSTNPQELHRQLTSIFLDPDGIELRERFLGLRNAYDQPVRPPEMPAFTSRHFGVVQPDRYGDSDATVTLPRLSEKPLTVLLSLLGQEDAEEIDATMDRFVSDLDDLLRAATPEVIENMHHYVESVYRNPKQPLPPDMLPDDEFEPIINHGAPSAIWRFVRPSHLVLTRDDSDLPEPSAPQRSADGPIYVTLTCRCDWEIEHGLGLVWRDGTELVASGTNDVRLHDGLIINQAG